MTGVELYARYRDNYWVSNAAVMALTIPRKWEHLSEEEQRAWDALAKDLS